LLLLPLEHQFSPHGSALWWIRSETCTVFGGHVFLPISYTSRRCYLIVSKLGAKVHSNCVDALSIRWLHFVAL